MVLKSSQPRLQAVQPDMTHINSLRNVISVEHTAKAIFVVSWLVLVLSFKEI